MTLSCPFCGSGRTLRLMELPDSGGQPVAVFSCSDCFVLFPDYDGFATPSAATAEQIAIHDQQWPALTEAEAAELRTGCGAVVQYLGKYLPAPTTEGARIFEIGSGRGGMIVAFRDAGYDVLGSDPSPHLVALARAAFDLDEKRLVQSTIEEMLPLIGAHEGPKVLVLWHVFEHLAAARQVWTELGSRCRTGDLIAMQLPSMSAQWLYRGHLFFATEPTLQTMAMEEGFEILELGYDHSFEFITVVFRKSGAASHQRPAVDALAQQSYEREVAAWRDRLQFLERDLLAAQTLNAERLATILQMDGMIKERDDANAAIVRLAEERFEAIEQMDRSLRGGAKELAAAAELANERLATIQEMDRMIRDRDRELVAAGTLAEERFAVIQQMDRTIREQQDLMAARRLAEEAAERLAAERFDAIQQMDRMLRDLEGARIAASSLAEERFASIQTMDQMIRARDDAYARLARLAEERLASMERLERLLDEAVTETQAIPGGQPGASAPVRTKSQ